MAKLQAVRVILSSGKIVLLRTLKIRDTEQAAMAAAHRAGENALVLQVLMQKELLKMLLLQVGENKLSGAEKEDIDGLFTVQEYGQLLKVIGKMSGSDDKLDPKIEMVSETAA